MATTKPDVLIPSDMEYKTLYKQAYHAWHALWTRAIATNLKRPPSCLDTARLFAHHPAFPVGLEVDQTGFGTAKSIWSCSGCNIEPFHRQWDFQAAPPQGATIVLSDQPNDAASSWFDQQAGHVTVLSLAWTYTLSARWAEMLSRANSLEYTNSKAGWTADKRLNKSPHDKTSASNMVLDLGHLTNDAARWWSAVLAPGQGWKAPFPHPRWSLRSPWSITLDVSTVGITLNSLQCRSTPSSSPAASFASALRYIQDYCTFHNCFKESRAALAATLLFPASVRERRKITLHVPRGAYPPSANATRNRTSPSPNEKHCVEELDRLLTLSTNWLGLNAILGSVFYESKLYSNSCGAWLQGTFAVLKGKQAITNTPVLAHMLFDRDPNIAFLWVGAILTGAQREFLRNPRSLIGMNRIDLHGAYWTNTVMSFIQEPTVPFTANRETISRADECRLMYITQEPPRDNAPAYPYPPLGETAIKDADLGVQMHAHCPKPHQLQFVSMVWRCKDSRKIIFEADARNAPISKRSLLSDRHDTKVEIDYSFLDRERDPSENATGNIFVWMRDMDGYTVKEREVREHDWVPTYSDDDDDEDAPPDGDGGSSMGLNNAVRVGKWMAKSNTDRHNSF